MQSSGGGWRRAGRTSCSTPQRAAVASSAPISTAANPRRLAFSAVATSGTSASFAPKKRTVAADTARPSSISTAEYIPV